MTALRRFLQIKEGFCVGLPNQIQLRRGPGHNIVIPFRIQFPNDRRTDHSTMPGYIYLCILIQIV